MEFIRNINNNYAEAIQALTPFVIGIISFFYLKLIKEKQMQKGDAAMIVKPIFRSCGKKYKILAVHQFKKSDKDPSGYTHIRQCSRKDQWEKLINVKSYFFWFRHKIIHKSKNDILTVIISRNGKL